MSRKRIKQYLMLLTAVGVVAVAASGAGTFATFNAEVSNNNNTFTAGTLFLHDTANGTTCTSEEGTANANNGSSVTDTTNGCSTLFTVNVGHATLSDTLGADISNAAAISSITLGTTLTGSGITLNPGDVLQLSDGTNTEDVVVSTQVSSGVTVDIYAEQLKNNYAAATPTNITQLDTTHYATIALNNAGSINASDIKFSVPTCTASHPDNESIGTIASGSYSAPNTTFVLASPSPYTIASGQTVNIGGTAYQLVAGLTRGVTTNVEVNAGSDIHTTTGSITWSPTFSSSTNFCSDAKLSIAETGSTFALSDATNPAKCASATDQSATTPFGCLFSGATALSGLTSASALTLVSARGGNAATGLDATKTRYFLIGIQLPGSTDNTYQNQKATFNLKWHIDAA